MALSTIARVFRSGCGIGDNRVGYLPLGFYGQLRLSSRKAKREKRMMRRRERLLAKQANPWVSRTVILQKQKERQMAKAYMMKKNVTRWPLIPEEPVDDVWLMSLYKPKKYSILEAVSMLRQLSDKTMFDCEDSFLHLLLDLNMQLEKNKYLDKLGGFIRVPHYYDEGESRRVIAASKTPDAIEAALAAGAVEAGGQELIDKLTNGAITKDDFDYLVATPDIMPDLMALRKQLKGRLPSIKQGSVSVDLGTVVDKFYNCKYYKVFHPLEEEHAWGQCKICVGQLDMDVQDVEENIEAFIKAICSRRPLHLGPFISDAMLIVEETKEEIHLDVSPYLPRPEKRVKKSEVLEEEEEEEEVREAAQS